MVPTLDSRDHAFLSGKEGVSGVPLSLGLIVEFKPIIPHQLRRKLVQLNQGNVLAQARTCAAAKGHHELVHVVGARLIHPAVRVETFCVCTKYFLIKVQNGGVDANKITTRDELSAERHALRGHNTRQSCVWFVRGTPES